jgi:hypothetical protein
MKLMTLIGRTPSTLLRPDRQAPRRNGGIHAPLSREARDRSTPEAVTVRTEVRTKRFLDGRVEEERYSAAIQAASTSPYAIMAALVEAGVVVPDFHRSAGPDERVILEISARL